MSKILQTGIRLEAMDKMQEDLQKDFKEAVSDVYKALDKLTETIKGVL